MTLAPFFNFVDDAPEFLYIKAEPGRGRYKPIEVEALQDWIDKLVQMVDKLTLENKALRKSRTS